MQKLLDLIPEGGSIILNGSTAGAKGLAALSAYSASKAALRSFARTWTNDVRARNPEQVESFKANIAQETPLGRIGHVDEIAKPVLFLASTDSSFITGIELTVEMGWLRSDSCV